MAGSRNFGAIGFMAAVLLATAAGIGAVHSMQKEERANLHQGVIRDQQLMALKKQQQLEALQHEGQRQGQGLGQEQ